ncbi:MAG: PQQ-dependent sugar dehydrogenase [Longimicrobiales bacterium]
MIASGLEQPNGVAFRNGALYVATASQILRFDDIERQLDSPPAPVVVRDDLPNPDAGHTWKFIAFGPDSLLYMSVGAPCNVCESPPMVSTILRMTPDGSELEVFAEGVRNSIGFGWHPTSGELWFTDNGRDMLGEDVPSDELNVAWRPGLHFGFPFCHQGDVSDPEFGAQHDFGHDAQQCRADAAFNGQSTARTINAERHYHENVTCRPVVHHYECASFLRAKCCH